MELRLGRRDPALASVLEWLPGVWSTLNAFLEAHSSSDVTVGPRLFLACPMDLDASQVNYNSQAIGNGMWNAFYPNTFLVLASGFPMGLKISQLSKLLIRESLNYFMFYIMMILNSNSSL